MILRAKPTIGVVYFIRQTGTKESMWNTYREHYGKNALGKSFMRFVGNVPTGWRHEVLNLMKKGRLNEST